MTQPAGTAPVELGVTVDTLSAAVVALYAQAEQNLIASLSRVVAHRLNDPSARAELVLLGQMRQAAERVVTQLTLRSGPLAQQITREAAQRGDAAAAAMIRQAIEGHPSLAAVYLAERGHRTAAAAQIGLDLAGKLDATRRGILRWTDDAYRTAVAEASSRLVLGREALTPRTARHLAWSQLMRQGVTGYTDTRGRRWNLASYVETATRTSVQRAYNASHEARMTSVGIDLFTVSHDGRPCPLCRPWEGAVLSTGATGRVTRRAADSDRMVTFTVAGTVTEARAAGLFHPNCRHVLGPYLPGVTKTGGTRRWTADDQARYDSTQRLRYLERQVRGWKRAEAGALNDLDRQRAARHVRATQAAIRAHVDQHGLVRRRQREQLDLGSK